MSEYNIYNVYTKRVPRDTLCVHLYRGKVENYSGETDLGTTVLNEFKWASLYQDTLETSMSAQYQRQNAAFFFPQSHLIRDSISSFSLT